MADPLTQVHVRENGKGTFAVDISVSGYSLSGDEPADMGGNGTGPAPIDYLTTALAECTTMTIRWYADRQKWPVENVTVWVSHQKGGPTASSAKQDVFTKRITIMGDALTEEQRAKLIQISANCPMQRLLEGTPLIQTETE